MKFCKLLFGVISSFAILSSCNSRKDEFVVFGKISNAINQKIYLEEIGTGNVLSLDSLSLANDGSFRFTYETTDYPMFYRLRINSQYIPFAVKGKNSIEITADNEDLQSKYQIKSEDNYNDKIYQINQKRHKADNDIDNLFMAYTEGKIEDNAIRYKVDSIAEVLRQDLRDNYIFTDPKSPAAYYALFQRKGNAIYFAPENVENEKAFAAVATAYDTYYADAPYTPFLKDLALKSVAQARALRKMESDSINKIASTEVSFPEIKLKDQRGEEQSLSKIAESGDVLLCFTSYAAEWSPVLVDKLRKKLENNPSLKIVDVSVDKDAFLWKNAAHNLPWISLHDVEGLNAAVYNVQTLPSVFKISGGEIKRIDNIEEL